MSIAGTGISFAQIRMHRNDVAPPPPPETFGAYSKSEESGGVIAMMDTMIADMDKEMTVGKREEADAQKNDVDEQEQVNVSNMDPETGNAERTPMVVDEVVDASEHKEVAQQDVRMNAHENVPSVGASPEASGGRATRGPAQRARGLQLSTSSRRSECSLGVH